MAKYSTPSVPLKPSQILPAKTGNQLDWDGFSGIEGVASNPHFMLVLALPMG